MDKRHIIAELVKRTGVKLDEADPALVLVELNRIMLEDSARDAAAQIEKAAKHFNDTATAQTDEFITLANETLSRFSARTNEIKTLLAQKGSKSVQMRHPDLTWITVAFISGIAIGIGFTLAV
jgi:hypothetical protein